MPARLNQRAKEAVSEEEGGGERNLSPATPTPFLSLPYPSLQALPYLPFLGNSRPSHYLTSSLSRLPPFLSPPRPSFSPCSHPPLPITPVFSILYQILLFPRLSSFPASPPSSFPFLLQRPLFTLPFPLPLSLTSLFLSRLYNSSLLPPPLHLHGTTLLDRSLPVPTFTHPFLSLYTLLHDCLTFSFPVLSLTCSFSYRLSVLFLMSFLSFLLSLPFPIPTSEPLAYIPRPIL